MRDDPISTKVVVMGNVVEVTKILNANRECHAIKVDSKHWVDPETGEIHEYAEVSSTKRTDNGQELRKTFAKIRALVNTNCKDPSKIRWITLTYAENMTDVERLYRDFVNFWKRFKRIWGHAEYIAVIEPQERGAWHVHLIVIWDHIAPYVPNDELRRCWRNGFVTVKAVDDIDNLGAYLSAYLGNAEVTEGGDEVMQRDGTTKRIKKGARLDLYPAGMNIYRCSRGIKKPTEFWCDSRREWHDYSRLVDGREPVWSKEYTFRDDSGREIRLWKEQYNLVRK